MLPILLLSLAICSSQANNADVVDSWARLRISRETVGDFEFQGIHVSLYNDSSNSRRSDPSTHRYYFSPLTRLDHNSASSIFNNLTNEARMHFNVEMWNEDLRNMSFTYLREEQSLNHVKLSNIGILPLNRVILASPLSLVSAYNLPSDWIQYRLTKILKFYFVCDSVESCSRLEQLMKNTPEQFADLSLKFSLESERAQVKDANVRISSVREGDLFTKLDQRFLYADSALVTAEDKRKILSESSQRILAETFDSDEVFGAGAQQTLMRILESLIFSGREILDKQISNDMWESVFWEKDNHRPDKTLHTVNDLYETSTKEKQDQLRKVFSRAAHGASDSTANAASLASSLTMREVNTDELRKLLEESRENIQWNGEEFVIKPMELSRINLAKIRSGQDFLDRGISVRYRTAILSSQVHIDEEYAPYRSNQVREELEELKRTTAEQMAAIRQEQAQQVTQIQQEQTRQIAEIRLEQTRQSYVQQEQANQIASNRQEQKQQITDARKKLTQLDAEQTNFRSQLSNSLSKNISALEVAVQDLNSLLPLAVVSAEEKKELLLRAAASGNVTQVRTLVAVGADVNSRDQADNLRTPLHKAAWNGHVGTIKTLIEAKADINAQDKDGDTPLHLAADRIHVDAIKTLAEAKAHINAKDYSGNTPLHEAAWKGDAIHVKTLVDLKADIHAKNNAGRTPLHWAAGWGARVAVQALLEAGAEKLARDNDAKTPKEVALFERKYDSIDLL